MNSKGDEQQPASARHCGSPTYMQLLLDFSLCMRQPLATPQVQRVFSHGPASHSGVHHAPNYLGQSVMLQPCQGLLQNSRCWTPGSRCNDTSRTYPWLFDVGGISSGRIEGESALVLAAAAALAASCCSRRCCAACAAAASELTSDRMAVWPRQCCEDSMMARPSSLASDANSRICSVAQYAET